MARKLSTEEKINALSRLSKKDKTVLLLFMAALVFIVVMVLFKFATGQYDMAAARFPDSTLADSPEYQSYQFKQSDKLNVPISFPSIPYGMFVAGEEACVQDDGCSFSYADDVNIVAIEAGEAETTDTIIKERLYRYLYGRDADTKVTYKPAITDTGYMNGLYAAYECGTYTVAGLRSYILSYRYFTGAGKDILFMIVTKDQAWLLQMKTLLDTMYYTMYTFNPNDGSAVILQNDEQEQPSQEPQVEEPVENPDVSSETVPEKEEESAGGTSVDYKGPISDHAKTQLEKIRSMRKEREESAQDGYLEGYGESDFYAAYEYEDTLTDAYFVFHYAQAQKTPAYAYLYGPDETMYEPVSINDKMSGDILFEVPNPAKGLWSFVVQDNSGLGDCTLDALDRGAYEALQQPFNENERSAPPVD